MLADVVVETHHAVPFEWDMLHLLIAFIVILGAIAVTYVVVRAMGWTIPDWLVKIVGICIVVVVGILALKFLWSLF